MSFDPRGQPLTVEKELMKSFEVMVVKEVES